MVISLAAGSFLERWIWWKEAEHSEVNGIIYRADTEIETIRDTEGLAAFIYKDNMLSFRWSTLGDPWQEGFWPFIKIVRIKDVFNGRLTSSRFRLLVDKEHPFKEWGPKTKQVQK